MSVLVRGPGGAWEDWALSSASPDPNGGMIVTVAAKPRRSFVWRLLAGSPPPRRLAFLRAGSEWWSLPALERCRDDIQLALSGLLADHERLEAGPRGRATAKAEQRKSETRGLSP